MRDWYDNPGLEEILSEQEAGVPDGCLGILHSVDLELDDPVPAEAVSLLTNYFAESIGTVEFVSAMEKIRMKALAMSPSFQRKASL